MALNQDRKLLNKEYLPSVSVVIPVFNGEVDLPCLINCIYTQTYPKDKVEYLIVDNASQDFSNNVIQRASKDAKLNKVNIHYLSEVKIQSSYAARNAGIRASTGEIIAFTDVDCRPQPEWLYALVQPFSNPVVGVVGGVIEALPGKTLIEMYSKRRNILSHKNALSHAFLPYAAGANLAIRKKTLQEVGLFRPYLTTGGDADICWRVQQHSPWQFCHAEKAVVMHRHRDTLQGLRNQRRRYGHSHQHLEELHNISMNQGIWSLTQILYQWSRWIVKELPATSINLVLGKATILDLLSTPISILSRQARDTGFKEAKLSELAKKIEWL